MRHPGPRLIPTTSLDDDADRRRRLSVIDTGNLDARCFGDGGVASCSSGTSGSCCELAGEHGEGVWDGEQEEGGGRRRRW